MTKTIFLQLGMYMKTYFQNLDFENWIGDLLNEKFDDNQTAKFYTWFWMCFKVSMTAMHVEDYIRQDSKSAMTPV